MRRATLRTERPVPRRHPRQRHPRVPARCSPSGAPRTSPARSSTSPTSAVSAAAAWPRSPPTRSPRACCCRRVRLYARVSPAATCSRIIERNSRTPDKVVGDVQALVAGVNVIARRVEELHERFGAGQRRAVRVKARPRRRRAAHARRLAELPAGRYEGSFTIDSDGVDEARTFDVQRRGHVEPTARSTSTSTGTSPQSRGAINSSFSQTMSGVVYAVRCFVDPTIPMNEGCFRPVAAPALGLAREPGAAGRVRRARR